MKKLIAVLAVMLSFATVAKAEFDVTAAANAVKEVADEATAKIEAKKADVASKKAESEEEVAAKKAEQEKAIEDAKTSLSNLKNALSK